MSIEQEDFQIARRISKAIQEYLEQIKTDGLRSTDIYPILAKKGLIEKDRHNGLHFRKFLRKLKDNNCLNLIPQCQYQNTKTDFLEWRFYRSKIKLADNKTDTQNVRKLIVPQITEDEINNLIKKAKPNVLRLPKTDESIFTPQMLETRKNYPRAYEIWTEKEIEIMTRAYKKFNKIDKVAELLERQPSVIRKKLDTI